MSETSNDLASTDYSADSIQVLEGLEAVRKRPAMYIGDIGFKGLHHLVYEVVDNSIDEALAGHCNDIKVFINEDNSITVIDNGRGIPTDMHLKEKKSALEVVMTVLHAGGKFDKESYKVSGGLHGVGVSCVNALSSHLKVTVYRNGKAFTQEYQIGKPMFDVKEIGTTDKRGTEVTFKPDVSIFSLVSEYSYETLSARLRELSFLNKGIKITITDKRNVDAEGNFVSDEFLSQGGLKEFVNNDISFEVNYDEVYSTGCWGNYGGKWSEFNEDDMIEKMLYCYNNREEVISKGKKAAVTASKYNKNLFIKNISIILNQYV